MTMSMDFLRSLASIVPRPLVASTQPKPDAPYGCCARFAAVEECNAERSLWKCSVCERLFSVAHPPSDAS